MNDILQKPMDHARMTELLRQLKSPQLCQSHIGSSVQGRAIPVVTVGHGEQPVLFVGGVHGMEWVTSAVLLQFLADIGQKVCRLLPAHPADAADAARRPHAQPRRD